MTVKKSTEGNAEVAFKNKIKSLENEIPVEIDGTTEKVILRISSNGERYKFEYSIDGEKYEKLADHDVSLVSTEIVGGFTGVVLGMFAEGEGSADFSYFDYIETQ